MNPETNHIAIFQGDHPLQVHGINVKMGLEAAGYQVDLFLYNCNYAYENTNGVGSVYDLSSDHKYWWHCDSTKDRVMEAFRYFVIEPLKVRDCRLVPAGVFLKSLELIQRKKYRCLIGIEKLGFVWAAALAGLLNIPYIYYSLELYPTSNVFHLPGNNLPWLKALRFLRLRQLENHYHKHARATIVQDEARGKELMRQNGVSSMVNLFLPVSLSGPPVSRRSDYLRTAFGISQEKKIILQFGAIAKGRASIELAIAAQAFPEDWVLISHGPAGEVTLVQRIKEIDRKNRIIISDKMLSSDELDDLIISADVGLCFYEREHINDYLTGFSSEKLVRYLRCGVPVVTFDYPTFVESVEKTGCGLCIHDLSALPGAICAILQDHDGYSKRAYDAFLRHFEFNTQFATVVSFIDEMEG